MNKNDYKDFWVFIEKEDGDVLPVSLELCSEVRKLCNESGEKLCAVVVGELGKYDEGLILDAGVDKIIKITGTGYETFDVDAYTELFAVLCRKYKPSAVFVGGTINGRDFAPRFACRLPSGCTSDATQLVYNKETGDIEFVEPAVGGKMMAVITVPEMRPQVGTIRPGTFKYQPEGRRKYIIINETINFDCSKKRTEILEFNAEEFDEALNLKDAEVIVCVGNGLKGADGLPRYRKLAELLSGKIACSRPLFDRGILPYPLVIGQSGQVIAPKIYISFGISGAVNHVTGITDSEKIIAVNKDPDAAIFKYSDYGFVGDMDEVCDQMIDLLEKRKANT